MLSPFRGKFRVTSPRGYRTLWGKRELHKGLDLVGEDPKIYAIADGTAEVLYEANGFGNYVRQRLADGRRIYYGHMKSISVKSGEKITRGQFLGVMGATGKVTGPHLHLELRPAGTSKLSLDVSEFTGIPNKVGAYDCAQEEKSLKVGDTVRVKQGAKTYTGGRLAGFVYQRDHLVSQIKGDRAVITYGSTVVAAVKVDDLVRV